MADRLSCFDQIGKTYCVQIFDDFIGGTCKAELDPIMGQLGAELVRIAKDCVRQKLKPSAAWKQIAAGFDSVASRDVRLGLAVKIGKSGRASDAGEVAA
jgi:hypothetical protein